MLNSTKLKCPIISSLCWAFMMRISLRIWMGRFWNTRMGWSIALIALISSKLTNTPGLIRKLGLPCRRRLLLLQLRSTVITKIPLNIKLVRRRSFGHLPKLCLQLSTDKTVRFAHTHPFSNSPTLHPLKAWSIHKSNSTMLALDLQLFRCMAHSVPISLQLQSTLILALFSNHSPPKHPKLNPKSKPLHTSSKNQPKQAPPRLNPLPP